MNDHNNHTETTYRIESIEEIQDFNADWATPGRCAKAVAGTIAKSTFKLPLKEFGQRLPKKHLSSYVYAMECK